MDELIKLCSFRRSIGRKEYFFLFVALILYIALSVHTMNYYLEDYPLIGFFSLFTICHGYWMLFAAYVARIRNIGKNPWYVLILFLPFLNLIFLVFLFFVRSKVENKSQGKI